MWIPVIGSPTNGIDVSGTFLLDNEYRFPALQLKRPETVLGFSTGTIANPTYGSGVDFPLKGRPTYQRGEATADRRTSGITFP